MAKWRWQWWSWLARAKSPFARLRAAHLRLGHRGERIACVLLRESGSVVLTRNYTGPHGELDLVAREGETICFVEVKTRRHERHASPAAAVNRAKRKKLRRTARQYLREIGWPALPFRFDIIEILLDDGQLQAVRWHRNAFPAKEERGDDFWHAPGGGSVT